MARWLVLAVCAFSLAGCLDPSPEGEPGADAGPAAQDAFQPIALSASDCVEVDAIVLVEFDHLDGLLPAGFKAADASVLLGSPVPTGKGGVFLATIVCGPSDLEAEPFAGGAVAIGVEVPDVAGDRPAATHLYELGHATPSPVIQSALADLSWPLVGTQVQTAARGPAAGGSGSVADAEGEVYSIEVTGVTETIPVSGTYRWWHDAPSGLSYFDYTVELDISTGPGTCTMRAGSVAALATGQTACTPGDAILMVGTGHNEVLRIEHLPGVHATA